MNKKITNGGSFLFAALYFGLFMVAEPVAASPAGVNVEKIKADYIYHLAEFTRWPEEVFQADDSIFLACFPEGDEVGLEFEMLARGNKLEERTVEVAYLADWSGLDGCNIVFLGMANAEDALSILSAARGAPMLTVGEMPGFALQGGMVNFFEDQGKIRFEINLDSVKESKLQISSKILKLARIIKGSEK